MYQLFSLALFICLFNNLILKVLKTLQGNLFYRLAWRVNEYKDTQICALTVQSQACIHFRDAGACYNFLAFCSNIIVLIIL